VSESIKKRLVELGCDERKILIHHSGIDLKRFQTTHKRPKSRKVTNVITVGFTAKKGLEYGIRAVAKLVSSNRNMHYYIVGDGPLKGKIKSLINDFNLHNEVTLCGLKDQTELIALLIDSDFMIAPSITDVNGDQEGIPNVLKEAMAVGLPVIGTKHAGIPELIQDGVSGFLVPERDVDALVDKMRFFIRYPEKAVKMGKAGCAFVRQEYDIDRLNDRLVECYESLLSKS
jgi:colanic acid/amylovoran biosynthesis glycosyltransferase